MSLAIVGCTVVDLIFPRVPRLPRWPAHAEFTPANVVLLRQPPIVTLGGNGANAAFVAARCGVNVSLHTQLGEDVLGSLARRWLTDAGCRVHSAKRGVTAANVTATNRRQQRATLFYPGAPAVMPALAGAQGGPTHVLVCGWPHPPLQTIAAGLRRARRAGAFTALDVGPILNRPWTMAQLRPTLAALDLLLANEYELEQITRADGLEAGLTRIRSRFSGHIVIKRGAEGALWLPAGSREPQGVSARRARVVNTVGAGDAFNGALLASLVRRRSLPEALRAACAVAASIVRSPLGIVGAKRAGDFRAARVGRPPRAQSRGS